MLHHLSGGAWDPHDVNVVASTSESSIQFWDLRTMKYASILIQEFLSHLIMHQALAYIGFVLLTRLSLVI